MIATALALCLILSTPTPTAVAATAEVAAVTREISGALAACERVQVALRKIEKLNSEDKQ